MKRDDSTEMIAELRGEVVVKMDASTVIKILVSENERLYAVVEIQRATIQAYHGTARNFAKKIREQSPISEMFCPGLGCGSRPAGTTRFCARWSNPEIATAKLCCCCDGCRVKCATATPEPPPPDGEST